ncbi:hypothetical protein GGR92_003368 [Spirosoma lacussanchae]|uniref:DUF4097 family beta strand repeat-containing protein n=1 Tax=Spirosoma lacussanchae TaxID=1884249 RepID=UPI001107DBB5|nr:DUF4097 family beta strand repeat-containing protein [Spirosoma lacussanchae]
MNKLVNILLVLFLAGTAPILAQTDAKERLVVPLSDPGKPGMLEVNLINGFIHVVGASGKDVVIEATSGSRLSGRSNGDRSGADGMRRIPTGNSLDLMAEERNNRVRVSGNSHHKAIDLTIRVPQRCSLKLHTVNNGDITVENVDGELEINNVNGPITLTNISGSAVAHTVNGELKASFREVGANAPMAFSTLNGRVDVTFPASMKANVKLKSDMGEVFSDFDIDVEKSQPKATRTSQGGMYRVSVEDWVYGKINNGGPEVMMKNMHGNIYVRKAK